MRLLLAFSVEKLMLSKEDIIRMAREAGFESNENNAYGELTLEAFVCVDYELERFAALVAAAAVASEREACAKWLEDEKDAPYWAELMRARGQV